MTVGNLIQRLVAKYKLSKGRCQECGKPLRDDATARFCSDWCQEEHAAAIQAY